MYWMEAMRKHPDMEGGEGVITLGWLDKCVCMDGS